MRDQLVATYSIVARDAATGDLGVAVQSCYLAVGAAVPWGDAGAACVAAAGHLTDDGVSVQANMMTDDTAYAYALQGRHDEARALLRRVFDSKPLLAEWMHRMIAAGIIPHDSVLVDAIAPMRTQHLHSRG